MNINNNAQEALKSLLNDGNDCHVKLFDVVDSTNTAAKNAVLEGLAKNALFIANKQTAGRGRQGKSFYSPAESGLYFSVVLHPNISLSDATGITAAAAVAVVEALKEVTKKDPKIKWVNDIFIDTKKVCGILTEAVSDFEKGEIKGIVVGIGINLTTSDFPQELKDIAGSVEADTDKYALAAKIYNRLKYFCDKLPCRDFMEDYRKYSLVLGKQIHFNRNGIDYNAIAENILDDGGLVVLTENGERIILNSGEISIKIG